MGRFNISVAVGVCLALGLFSAALADPFSDGADAYDRGDYVTARTDLTPLAEKGDPRAATYLAVIYYEGLGVPKNALLAFKWATQGALGNNSQAENILGAIYLSGQFVLKSPVTAEMWFKRAASQGFTDAQFNLAGLYERGLVHPNDPEIPLAWLRIAAWSGQPYAQYKLGERYRSGEGTQTNLSLSYMWLSLSRAGFAENHDDKMVQTAGSEIDSVSRAIPPNELSSVQQRVKDWTPITATNSSVPIEVGVFKKFDHYSGGRCGPAGPYQPDRACRNGVSGTALIGCALGSDGGLSACSVISESPTGFGFGAMSILMIERKAITRASTIADGPLAVDQMVRLQIDVPFTGNKF